MLDEPDHAARDLSALVCELLKRIPKLFDQPAILVSAHGRDEAVKRAVEAAAADYVVKPFSPQGPAARARPAP